MTALTLSSLCRSLGLSPRGRATHGAAPAIVAAGLIAEWRFDDGAGQTLADTSGNGHHGQLGSTAGADANDPSWAANPARLEFDGSNDQVVVPDFTAPSHFHLDLVLRADTASATFALPFIHGHFDTDAVLEVFRNGTTAPLQYRCKPSGSAQTFNGVRSVFNNGWHLVQVNHTGSKISAHVDGQVDVSPTTASTPVSSTQPVWFGARATLGAGSKLYFKGAIAWAAWYSVSFDDSQRAQNEAFARYLMSGRGVTLP
jgi:Concanavalin A-like lectin/glucanases superfamily